MVVGRGLRTFGGKVRERLRAVDGGAVRVDARAVLVQHLVQAEEAAVVEQPVVGPGNPGRQRDRQGRGKGRRAEMTAARGRGEDAGRRGECQQERRIVGRGGGGRARGASDGQGAGEAVGGQPEERLEHQHERGDQRYRAFHEIAEEQGREDRVEEPTQCAADGHGDVEGGQVGRAGAQFI